MKKVVFIGLILCLNIDATAQWKLSHPEKLGFSEQRLERLTETLDAYVENDQLAGGVALIARKGDIGYLHVFGQRDIESGDVMQEDTIFRIASQTKAIVSAGIMILQEEGKLLITDPLHKYIPEFENSTVAEPNEQGGYTVVPANRAITLRDLLTHTAGIGYGNGVAADKWEEAGIQGWYFAYRDEPVLETIKRMGALPMDAHPGEKWVYGYNTDILGAVIEVASGITLAGFLADRIFEPLGMNDTHFYLPEEKLDRLAVVYSSKEEGGIEKAPDPGMMVGQGAYVEGPRMSYSGGAGLLSTAFDYARFLQMILNGGELDGERVLSRHSVAAMGRNHMRDVPFNPGVGFGLGFSVVEDAGARGNLGSVGELGWGGAYHTSYWIDQAEEIVAVYMTNLIPARQIDDHQKFRTLLYQALQ